MVEYFEFYYKYIFCLKYFFFFKSSMLKTELKNFNCLDCPGGKNQHSAFIRALMRKLFTSEE